MLFIFHSIVYANDPSKMLLNDLVRLNKMMESLRHDTQAAQYFQEARILFRQRKYDEAISKMKKNITILESSPSPNYRSLAVSYQNLAIFYSKKDLLDKANKYFEKSIHLIEKIPFKQRWNTIPLYTEYASFLFDKLGNFKLSNFYYSKAMKLALDPRSNEPPRLLITSLLNVSIYFDSKGRINDVLLLCKRAEEISDKSKNIPWNYRMKIYSFLSDEYLKNGEINKYISYMNKSKKILNKHINGKNNIETIRYIMRRVTFYRNYSLFNESLDLLNSLQTSIDKMPWGIQYDYYNNKGIIYSNLKQYNLAKKSYFKAYKLWKKHRGYPNAALENNIGLLYCRKGNYLEALKHYTKATFIHKKQYGLTLDNAPLATNYVNIGSLYDDMGDYKKAESYYTKALDIRKHIFGYNSEKTISLYSNFAVLYNHMGKAEKSYIYINKAFDHFLKLLERLNPVLTQKEMNSYLHNNFRYTNHLFDYSYKFYLTIASEKKRNRIKLKLINKWLNYKGAIFDSENAIATLYATTKDPKLKAKIGRLAAKKRQLAKLYQTLPSPKEQMAWREKVAQLEAQIRKLTQEVATKAQRFKEEQGLSHINAQEISQHLKKDELYVDYAKAGDYYYLFTLDHSGKITFERIDTNATWEIDRLVQGFREDISTILKHPSMSEAELKTLTQSSRQKLSKLYELALKKPLGVLLSQKRVLIISPDGALRLLPFEAMYDAKNKHYLIEEKAIRYIPSGKELLRLYKYAKSPSKTRAALMAIFADPDFNTQKGSASSSPEEEVAITPNTSRSGIVRSLFKMRFPPLPGTKAEAESIASTLKEKALLREYEKDRATETNLLHIKNPKILHIATHGFFINDPSIPNPMLKSGLALAGANASLIRGRSEGIVTALKLSGLELEGTDLVVLSACNTGVVDLNSTDTVSGLSKAFIQAGAKDIVMSLWSVNDRATKDLMSSFYRQMQKHESYEQALREAKLKMLRQGMHPFFWAPFILSGL